jgi:DNA (cytosine-5)-methyltransferase 1
MRYATFCSGIEAPSVAWKPLGWEPVWFSEIDKFANTILSHHYPGIPNLGDMTKINIDEVKEKHGPIDLLFGGTPCTSFSSSGKRKGLDDESGRLAIQFFRLASKLRVQWVVWENVTGVFNANEGQDFATILNTIRESGYYGFWRTLDAQYFGVPQRRRRVFFVGYLGDWRPAAAVLFESKSMCRNPTPQRKKREEIAPDIAPCITANSRHFDRAGTENGLIPEITGTLQARMSHGYSQQEVESDQVLIEKMNPETAGTLMSRKGSGGIGQQQAETDGHSIVHPTLQAQVSNTTMDGINPHSSRWVWSVTPQNSGRNYNAKKADVSQTVTTNVQPRPGQGGMIVQEKFRVRRLTPIECERLQGLPDDYTNVIYRKHPAKDNPRYRVIGRAVAVPVVRWFGERIDFIHKYIQSKNEGTKPE